MPELPEVETIRRSLEPVVVGRTVCSVDVRCASLRKPVPPGLAQRVTGRRIAATGRRAKYLLIEMDDGLMWIFHMGMSGRLQHFPAAAGEARAKHDHLVVLLDDDSTLVFNDPRRFGLVLLEDGTTKSVFADYGPEPLDRAGFHGDYLAGFRSRTNRTIKDVLMDQRIVAGLGNIYVNEILFLAGVRPRRRLRRVTGAECERIVDATRTIIEEAIEHRGSSVSDFLDGIGRRGGYQWRHRVYGREGEPCPNCGASIRAIVVGQRSSFYCSGCQR